VSDEKQPIPAYRLKRRAEYPLVEDQLDAIWKGGEAQEEMKMKIEAIKAKYPKPSHDQQGD
jgi:hypothetical protein